MLVYTVFLSYQRVYVRGQRICPLLFLIERQSRCTTNQQKLNGKQEMKPGNSHWSWCYAPSCCLRSYSKLHMPAMHMPTVDEAVNDGANDDGLDHRNGLFPRQRQDAF